MLKNISEEILIPAIITFPELLKICLELGLSIVEEKKICQFFDTHTMITKFLLDFYQLKHRFITNLKHEQVENFIENHSNSMSTANFLFNENRISRFKLSPPRTNAEFLFLYRKQNKSLSIGTLAGVSHQVDIFQCSKFQSFKV